MSSFLGGGGSGGGGGTPGQMVGPVYNSNYSYLVPTTGATINLNNTDFHVILDPAADLGSLNLVMPPAPFDGQLLEISTSNHRIGGFALLPNVGQTVVDSPNALSDGSPIFAIYRAANTTWYVTYSVPFLPANNDLSFFVATTGSDSNPGTVALPFATLQHAINVASEYDWQSVWQPSIICAAGSYSGPTTLNCLIGGPFKNLTSALIIHGSGVATCTFAAGGIQIINIGAQISGFTFTDGSTQASINPIENAAASIDGDLTFNFSGAGFAQFPFFTEGENTFIFVGRHTMTYAAASIKSFFLGGPGGIFFFQTNIVLPVALTVLGNGFFDVGQNTSQAGGGSANADISGVVWTNFGGVTGPQLNAYQFALLLSSNGVVADWPGSTLGSVDSTVIFSGNATGTWMNFNAGIPTIAQVSTNCWGIWKDTSGGGVYAVANDAGTIKKVALV